MIAKRAQEKVELYAPHIQRPAQNWVSCCRWHFQTHSLDCKCFYFHFTEIYCCEPNYPFVSTDLAITWTINPYELKRPLGPTSLLIVVQWCHKTPQSLLKNASGNGWCQVHIVYREQFIKNWPCYRFKNHKIQFNFSNLFLNIEYMTICFLIKCISVFSQEFVCRLASSFPSSAVSVSTRSASRVPIHTGVHQGLCLSPCLVPRPPVCLSTTRVESHTPAHRAIPCVAWVGMTNSSRFATSCWIF